MAARFGCLFALITACTAAADPLRVNAFAKGGTTVGVSYAGEASPSWGLGLDFAPMPFLEIEVAYEGAATSIAGTPNSAFLRSGPTALLKIVAPFGWVRPYAAAGLGVGWFVPSSASGYTTSFFQEIPLCVGIDFWTGHLLLGLRFTERVVFNARLQEAPTPVRFVPDLQLAIGIRF